MDEKAKRTLTFPKVQPFYLRRLYEKYGNKCDDMLGVSSGYIGKSIRNNTVRPVFEVAAKGLLDKESTVSEKEDIWFVQPGEHKEMLLTLFRSLNIRFAQFKD